MHSIHTLLDVVGGYKVTYVVVWIIVVAPVVTVAVLVAVPDLRKLLQNTNASEVCPMKASRLQSPT